MSGLLKRSTLVSVLVAFLRFAPLWAAERTESFDVDPKWDGLNNRPSEEPREIEQDFGYSATRHSVPAPGEIGGFVTPAAEPAWYAMPVGRLTLDTPLSASGTMVVPAGGGNTLVGFFNPATAREWRTANSLVWRINGRGETLHAHFEYMTGKWRAGAGIIGRHDKEADRMHPVELPTGERIRRWSLEYKPGAPGEGGVIRATLDGHVSTCTVNPEHRDDGATFTHFGILNVIKSADGGGGIWLGDLVVNGESIRLDRDPKWEGHGNRTRFKTTHVRPWFDIGWSDSNHAGGARRGEIGGHFYRGDCREPGRLGYYGDRVGRLTLDQPLRAGGRISFHRGVSDSTTLFGFFHHARSVRVNESQKNGTPESFLGFALEGPSSEGFYVYPVCRPAAEEDAVGFDRARCPRIYPDGSARTWSLEYDPAGGGGHGTITVTLDDTSWKYDLPAFVREAGAEFDRFGFVTPWIDGNGQTVYLDDLRYTSAQD